MDHYGVIGWPLAHTWSPRIHQHFARLTGEALRYDALPTPPELLEERLTNFFADGGLGLNVTVPHKEAVIARCASLTDRARQAGAVNTLKREADGSLTGDNTDGAGLVHDLRVNHGVSLEGVRLLMVGAGGAARGTAGPLLDAGCREIIVANRTLSRAQRLVEDVIAARSAIGSPMGSSSGTLSACDLASLATREGFDIVVNATSAGLKGEVPPVPVAAIAGAFCYDMLYGDVTPFADWAREQGAGAVATGLGMLVEQAAEAFLVWRGVRPPTGPVYADLTAT